MCSGLFLEKIFFVGLFKLSGKLPSPDQNDTYVPPSFSSSCKLSKILFQFVEKKLQFQTIFSILCCIKKVFMIALKILISGVQRGWLKFTTGGLG